MGLSTSTSCCIFQTHHTRGKKVNSPKPLPDTQPPTLPNIFFIFQKHSPPNKNFSNYHQYFLFRNLAGAESYNAWPTNPCHSFKRREIHLESRKLMETTDLQTFFYICLTRIAPDRNLHHITSCNLNILLYRLHQYLILFC